ncbi:hypothetical protein [Rhizobium leguminosarum]|uniref:Uncharacterized protein n=1 Tax=Rhizobium leguminosarum TaxID=384 RepID=A0A7K3VX20_RHILE|nr:hypothetical protein [Rhizobium leguminosarum]NEK20701.1 hypothetical protein [Rhizobium leguminosarum]
MIEGFQVDNKWAGLTLRMWKWAAFGVAGTALPLLGQIDWKTLVLDYQSLIVVTLAVIAASATIFEVLAGGQFKTTLIRKLYMLRRNRKR